MFMILYTNMMEMLLRQKENLDFLHTSNHYNANLVKRQEHGENSTETGNQLSDLSGSRWKRRTGNTGIHGRWREKDSRHLYL